MENIIESLNWRYATKRMTGEKVPSDKLGTILEAIRLSGSAMGLQPYTIIVIDNPELKKKIQPAANNQPQIVESSHLLVFAAWENLSEERIDNYIELIAQTRGVTIESLADFSKAIKSFTSSKTKEELYIWNARQAYIALGTGLVAAADQRIDATPMEGFKPDALDEVLSLREKGLRSVALLSLGYRDENNDRLVKAKKVRRHKEELFINM